MPGRAVPQNGLYIPARLVRRGFGVAFKKKSSLTELMKNDK